MKNSTTFKKNLATAVACILVLSLLVGFAGCNLFFPQPVQLTGISATYSGGDVFVGESLVNDYITVTAQYSDNTSKNVTGFEVTDWNSESAGSKTVTISYTEGGVTKTATITVNVVAILPLSLQATYSGDSIAIGEQPDVSKLAVTVSYNNGQSKPVTNYSHGSVDSSTAGVKEWEISYTELDVTVSTKVQITVKGEDVVADLEIHFINLGTNSGDSIYIKAGDTDILIDCGAIASSAATIKNYLDQEGRCEDGILEYVIATHADSDHIAAFVGTNSVKGILDVYQCENIIRFARTNKNTTVLNNFLAKCDEQHEKYNTNVYTALDCYNNANGAQREYEIADGITMEILYQKYYVDKISDENNYSVCLLFKQGDKRYLFTGDLEEAGEKSLVESNDLPEVELFKAGHHGSATSSNTVLLNVIRPKYVVASCAAGDQYNFPTQDFINRVAPFTDKVFVTGMKTSGYGTGINGNVVFSCVNGEISVNCSISNLPLKDSQWFKDYRTCPSAWL